jgi:Kef-type K+ transport system membrane component KefB
VSGAYTFLTVLTITLFPDGRPRSTPERWLVGLILVATGVAVASGLLSEPLGSFDHPFASPEIATTARSTFDSMLQVYGFFLLAAYVFKVVDFRRSESVRRAQLKWLIYTLTLYLVFTIVSFGLIGMEDFNLTGLTLDALFLGLIPTTMAVAVLRYRLYEIDRIVSRTVTYAIVVIVVAAVFAVPVILIPSRLGTSSDWVVAGATLAAAAVFNPVRRSIQNRVDRRFNRSRYDAAREVGDLASRLNAAPASEPPIEDTVDLVIRLMEPAAIGVWVRG